MTKNRILQLSSLFATACIITSSVAFAESPPIFPPPNPGTHIQQEANRLAAMEWRLASIQRRGQNPVTNLRAGLPAHKIYLVINNGKISVRGACNQIFGKVTLSPPNRLYSSQMASTRKMCGDKRLTQAEREMMRYMRQLTSYNISGSWLTLHTQNNVVLKFAGKLTEAAKNRPPAWPAPPIPVQPHGNKDIKTIKNMNWQLNALIRKGEQPRYRLLSGQSTRTVNMTLENNRFVVNAGCNSMFSGATFTPPHRIKVGRMGSTMKGCPAIQAKTESELSRYFPGFQTYWLKGNRLNLVMRDQTTLQFIGKPKHQGHTAAKATTVFIEMQYSGGMQRWREAKYLANGVRTNNNEPWRRGLPTIEGFKPQPNMQYVVRVKQYYNPNTRKMRWVKDRITMNGVYYERVN